MILTDTGPLVALLDADDRHHQRCLTAIRQLPAEPMLTTWPCFTEAIYLLGAVGGYSYQANLWRLYTGRRLHVHAFSSDEIERMRTLMETYQDTPMDLADASLIAAAEKLNIQQSRLVWDVDYPRRLTLGRWASRNQKRGKAAYETVVRVIV